MYESNYVCTLMANEPRADIEIRTNPRSTNAAISASTAAAIRIRFSRKLRTMQVFSSEPRLCKKTMFCTARGVPTDAGDWALLSKDEKECFAALLDFLRVVEAVEGLSRDTSEPPSQPTLINRQRVSLNEKPHIPGHPQFPFVRKATHPLHQPALANQSQHPQSHRFHHRPRRRLPADRPT